MGSNHHYDRTEYERLTMGKAEIVVAAIEIGALPMSWRQIMQAEYYGHVVDLVTGEILYNAADETYAEPGEQFLAG